MSTIAWSLDAASKKWLTILSATFVVCGALLVYGFIKVVASQPSAVTVLPPAPVSMQSSREHSRPEPLWNRAAQPQSEAGELARTSGRVSPFDNEKPTRHKADPKVRQAMVHEQAEYFRQLIADGKVPEGLGNLTKEQVDEMEKNGELVW